MALLVLLFACSPVGVETSPTPSPVALLPSPAQTGSPVPESSPIPDLEPGPLKTLSGPPVEPNQAVLGLHVQVDNADFMVGLRPNLAPKNVDRLVEIIRSDGFLGQSLEFSSPGFVVLPANKAKLKPAARKIEGEKNRIAPAPGLIYFDGQSRLALAIQGGPVPSNWICVGQLQVGGLLVEDWRSPQPKHKKVLYFGDARA